MANSVNDESKENKLVPNEQDEVGLSHFKLVRVLGKGTFGTVFLGRKIVGTDSGSLYAVKIQKKPPTEEKCHRSRRERDILAQLEHPFVVKMYYAFHTINKMVLILDFYGGGTLLSLFQKVRKFTEANAAFYLAEISLGLSYLHSLKVVYRDLKPSNVLLSTNGHIALADFGTAKLLYHENQTYSFTGTLSYMAPEVIEKTGHSFSADWWSFGVIMFQMLTGRSPFRGTNRKEIMSKIINAQIIMPTNLSVQAGNLLRVLFRRIPANRLGAGPGGIEDLKNHEFFTMINFDDLLAERIPPPFQPAVCSTDDVYSDPELPYQLSVYSHEATETAINNDVFDGFSFVAPWLQENDQIKPKATLNSRMPSSHLPHSLAQILKEPYKNQNTSAVRLKATMAVTYKCEESSLRVLQSGPAAMTKEARARYHNKELNRVQKDL